MKWLVAGAALGVLAALLAPEVDTGCDVGDHDYDYLALTWARWRVEIDWGRP